MAGSARRSSFSREVGSELCKTMSDFQRLVGADDYHASRNIDATFGSYCHFGPDTNSSARSFPPRFPKPEYSKVSPVWWLRGHPWWLPRRGLLRLITIRFVLATSGIRPF